MKRSVGVTLIAVLSLIGSGLMLLFGTLTLVGLAFAPIPRSAQFPESPVVFRIILLASSLAYFLPAVWGIVTGIGLLRLKNWARISTIVFSALLTLMSGFTVLVTLLLPMPARPSSHLDSSMMSLVRLALAGFWGVQLGIGIWWLAFFNRAKVREQFVPTAAPLSPGALPEGAPARRSFPVSTLGRGASRRPLSITILAWFLLVGSLFIPFGIPMRAPAILFTTVVSGWPAALLLLTFTGLQLWIGIGLLRLRATARLAAIVYFAFGFVNSAVFYLAPGGHARVLELIQRQQSMFPWMREMQDQAHVQLDPMPFLVLGAILGCVVCVLVLYFLITRKFAFETTAAT